MYEAIHRLDVMPDLLLIDAVAVDIPIPDINHPWRCSQWLRKTTIIVDILLL